MVKRIAIRNLTADLKVRSRRETAPPEEVLQEVGFSWEEIIKMKAEGVIARRDRLRISKGF